MGEKYPGIRANNNINAADVVNALDTKVSLSGNESINGTKTFVVSPGVPSKATTASNSSTVIATEAQVKAAADTAASQLATATSTATTSIAAMGTTNEEYTAAALAGKVSRTGAVTEEISGTKTFAISPLVPSKATAAGNNSTVIATEAQVYAANVWQ
jgi:hypothetical protein